jgi:hypothetical protein
MWNGRNEQMLTIFFLNPWLEPDTMKPRSIPDWTSLTTWMNLRERYAAVPREAPPPDDGPPVLH